jgi:hypothetical protein
MRSIFFALLLLFLSSTIPAQRFVVDASGGGQFTDLATAVAAVPDGATLFVKRGYYPYQERRSTRENSAATR